MRNFALYLAFGAGAFILGLVFDADTPVNAAPPASLAITSTTVHAARVGLGYTTTVAASGGTKPYAFSATGLPAGLTINKMNGVVTGTAAAGTYGLRTVAFKVTDSAKPTPHTVMAKL